jgi:hypothetical protein
MPSNPFPESLEKQSLRRRDAVLLEDFKTRVAPSGLRYCGLTSAEFRDVQAWRHQLREVLAVESNTALLNDLDIHWRQLNLGLKLRVVPGDILDYLRSDSCAVFDVYNLDFCGGFTNPRRDGSSRCREAIRSLASRHRRDQLSFALIATFNIRDRGVEQYDALLSEIRLALEGLVNVDSNLAAHEKTHAAKIKLSFTYTCWHDGVANDFAVKFEDPFVYSSGVTTLVHFYGEFSYQPRAVPTPHANRDALVDLANLPLRRMDGRITRMELNPPPISRSAR